MLSDDSVITSRPSATCILLSGLSVVLYNLRTLKFDLDQPLELWPLALVCLSPMIAAQECRGAILVSSISFAACSGIFFWSIGLELYLGLVTGLIWGALWDLLEVSDEYVLDDKSAIGKPIRRAAYWTGIVYITSYFLGTFFALSTPFHDVPSLIQPISWFGFYSLEFTVFLVNAALGQLVFTQRRKPLVALVLWCMLGWSLLSIIQFYILRTSTGPSARVATITPGAELGGVACDETAVEQYERDATCNGTLERQMQLTKDAVMNKGARFVVWPEMWLGPFQNLTEAKDYIRSEIGQVAGQLNIFMSIGALVGENGNIAMLVGPGGKILGIYGKQNRLGVVGEKSSLRFGYPTYEVPSTFIDSNGPWTGKVGMLICYDVDFSQAVRSMILQGAGLILNPSQDWSAVRDHLSQVVFRAVESRVAIVKADMAWDSAIVDQMGRKVARFQSRNERENVLVGRVELGDGRLTGAALTNDLFPLICVGFSLFVLMSASRKQYFANTTRSVLTPNGDYGALMSA